MRTRKNLNEWYAELLRENPKADRATQAILAGTVQPRKLDLLCDECLDHGLVDWLRNEPRIFKVFTMPSGRSDEHLWQEAQQRRRLLVTSDRDFKDDRVYPLHKSPGVLYVEGTSTNARIMSFTRFFAVGDFLNLFNRLGWPVFQGSKSSVSAGHGEYRIHDSEDGSQMIWPLWDAPVVL